MDEHPKEFGPWKVVDVLKDPNVYKVRIANRPKGGLYALKMLPHLSKEGIDHYQRFKAEIECLKGLAHRNVVELIDYDLNPLNPYLVTPYYNLGSLEDYQVKKRWRRPICKGIIRGYSYLTQQGIVKYDNNPKNIFLHQHDSGSCPIAIVGDFGGCRKSTKPDHSCNTWMKVLRMVNEIMEG